MTASDRADDVPLSGSIPVGAGQAAVVRIPVPGTSGLAVEFRPRGRVPRGGSTSTLFIHDVQGRRQLRLDYGPNPRIADALDFHWHHERVYGTFGVENNAAVGRLGALVHRASKAYRWGGRLFVLAGAAVDVTSIVVASNRLRRASEVVSAYALAWAGCRAVGAAGAWAGSLVPAPGFGTAGGAVAGCIVGGFGGYKLGEALGAVVFEWAENTVFTTLPRVPLP